VRGHRRREGGVRGVYLTLEQAAAMTTVVQSAIFAFGCRGL
jgi:hypothetical protein